MPNPALMGSSPVDELDTCSCVVLVDLLCLRVQGDGCTDAQSEDKVSLPPHAHLLLSKTIEGLDSRGVVFSFIEWYPIHLNEVQFPSESTDRVDTSTSFLTLLILC